MALHLASNGAYGIMLYNNKYLPDEILKEMLAKYGNIHEFRKGEPNYIFVYYKNYEEARACYDELKDTADFNAKPARPRETNRGEQWNRPGLSRLRSKSTYGINQCESNPGEAAREQNGFSNQERRVQSGDNVNGYRPRSRSVARVDILNANRRADLIQKVIKSEQDAEKDLNDLSDLSVGGSYDNLMEKVNQVELEMRTPRPLPRISRTKSRSNEDSTEGSAMYNLVTEGGTEEEPSLIPVKYLYDRQFTVLKKTRVVVIGGLPSNLTIVELGNLCSYFTKIADIKMVDSHNFGETIRAYVYVETDKAADLLVREFNKKPLWNNVLVAFKLTDIC